MAMAGEAPSACPIIYPPRGRGAAEAETVKFEKAPPKNVELLDRVVASLPGTQRRTMFGYAAYFAGGKLAVGLFADGVCMKLSPEDRDAALKLGGVTEFAP